jgi:ADP-ribosyltransferase exoenzyme
LSDEEKMQILGKDAFAAYKNGDIKNLKDFVGWKNDKRFGRSVYRRPLAQVLADNGVINQPPTIGFKTIDAAKLWADSKFRKFEDSLTKPETDSLGAYQSIGYKYINNYLRGTITPKQLEYYEKANITSQIKAISSSIAKGSLPADIKVYRGFGINSESELKRGMIFTDPSFLSVSLNKSVAQKFAGFSEADGKIPVILQMILPKGLPAAYLENILKMNETEILLERNSSFEVESIIRSGGKLHVKAKFKR